MVPSNGRMNKELYAGLSKKERAIDDLEELKRVILVCHENVSWSYSGAVMLRGSDQRWCAWCCAVA